MPHTGHWASDSVSELTISHSSMFDCFCRFFDALPLFFCGSSFSLLFVLVFFVFFLASFSSCLAFTSEEVGQDHVTSVDSYS